MKKSILLIVILAGVVGLAFYYWPAGDSSAEQQQGMAHGQQAVPVDVMALHKEQVRLFDKLPGRVAAQKVAEIRPQVSGIITKRLFKEGSYVEVGQQLYQIDPGLYQAAYSSALAQLQRARANLQAAESTAKRYDGLIEKHLVSQQQYDDVKVAHEQAKADVAIAEASVARAKIDLDYTKVYAPISGRVGRSLVTEGALVTANQESELTRVTQLDPVYVDLTQSSAELMRMRSLSKTDILAVSLDIDGSAQPYAHKGEMQFADVTVDESTSSVVVRAEFPNPDQLLLPGMFVRATIELPSQQGFLVPQRATNRTPDGSLQVWRVAADNTVSPFTILAEREIGNHWLVTEGLKEGDTIVVAGFQKIMPGATVHPTTSDAVNQAPAAESAAY